MTDSTLQQAGQDRGPELARRLELLEALRRKVLWLSSWMIHNANHLRESRDGLKVGGHQASSASLATLMTALYFDVLRPQDRVAVKPHASPIFHAIQYLLGNQTRENLERFRAFGGAQSYPSRTKDRDDVDFSTGSVGLGVAMTSFASLVQDYVRLKSWAAENEPRGRMVALVGDAELDEGNIYEAMLEGWKHDLRDVWWVIDYNRQSLDAVVSDRLFGRIDQLFNAMGWDVVTLKYGKRLEAAFERPGGGALRHWIDECPNSLYSALVFKGGAAWRQQLLADMGDTAGIRGLLQDHDDDSLAGLMTNLAGSRPAVRPRGLPRDTGRPADLPADLYDQGLRATLRRPQGQPRRPDEPGADGRLPGCQRSAGRGRVGALCRARRAGPDLACLPRPGAVQRPGQSGGRHRPAQGRPARRRTGRLAGA